MDVAVRAALVAVKLPVLTRQRAKVQDALAQSSKVANASGCGAHRQVLDACRDFQARYQRMPTTRVFVKHLGQTLGPDYAGSAALARQVAAVTLFKALGGGWQSAQDSAE